jgi:hypothetical protein
VGKEPKKLADGLRGSATDKRSYLERVSQEQLAKGKEELFIKIQRHPLNTIFAFIQSDCFIGLDLGKFKSYEHFLKVVSVDVLAKLVFIHIRSGKL